MMSLKSTIAGLALALVMAPIGASAAVVVTGDHSGPGGVDLLSIEDVVQINIDADRGDNTNGCAPLDPCAISSLSFGFKATELLVAIETNSLNTTTGFVGASAEWNSEADGSGDSYGTISGQDLIDGKALKVVFQEDQAIWLIASWEQVDEDGSNFDLRVEAVPAPAGILLMGTVLAGFGVMRRRKKAA